MPVIPAGWISREVFHNLNLVKLFLIIMSEVLLGLTVSLFIMCMSEIFKFGGMVIDNNVGFTMAQTIDPSMGTKSSLFSSVLVQVFFMAFIVYNGHHEIIRLAAYSFKTLPPGAYFLDASLGETVIKVSGQIFYTGLQIGFPILAAIIIINLSMGLLARIGQDFPVLMLSFPLRLGMGFIILMGVMPVVISVMRKVNREMLEWIALLVKF
jgi:flagellar biosynthetic protein FliR